jgi:predicted nucleic-acid-binding Zn-ribbon protein
MNNVRNEDTFDSCPLLNREIDMTECYDIQMVMSHFVKESVLDFELDRTKAAVVCEECPYNQLYDTAQSRRSANA